MLERQDGRPRCHALVIGAQTHRLRGADADAVAMAAELGRQGFPFELRTGAHATRDEILAAWDRLIERARPDDAVVYYFSGHGGLAINTNVEQLRLRREFPAEVAYVVPFDDDPGGPFRGVSEWELAFRLQALTLRTRNVVVIHDCCHAEGVVRGPKDPVDDDEPTARTVIRRFVDLGAHFQAMLAADGRFETRYPDGNPFAVRLAAATRKQRAWEVATAAGGYRGVFTAALVDALAAVGDEVVTWAWLVEDVRDRMATIGPLQRAEVQGPAGRALFSQATPAPAGAVPVFRSYTRGGASTTIAAGRLLGVAAGQVVPIARLSDTDSVISTEPVTITAAGAFSSTIARPPRNSGTVALLAGEEVHARAARLRGLAGGHGLGTDAVRVMCATVVDGEPLALTGEPLAADAPLAIEFLNRARHPLHVHAFAVAADDRITDLHPLAASGVLLEPGERETIGAVPGLGLVGIVARPDARPVEILMIATASPADLRGLATPDPAHALDGAAIRTAPLPLSFSAPALRDGHREFKEPPPADPDAFLVVVVPFPAAAAI